LAAVGVHRAWSALVRQVEQALPQLSHLQNERVETL
jgi:hypothetical protein